MARPSHVARPRSRRICVSWSAAGQARRGRLRGGAGPRARLVTALVRCPRCRAGDRGHRREARDQRAVCPTRSPCLAKTRSRVEHLSLSITAMAALLPWSDCWLALLQPAPRMKLVEIVSAWPPTRRWPIVLHATATAWGKVAVHARSTPVSSSIASRVPTTPKRSGCWPKAPPRRPRSTRCCEGCGFLMGPFELMDLIGHDQNLRGHLFGVRCLFRRQAFYPSLIQQELVQAGRLAARAAAALRLSRRGEPTAAGKRDARRRAEDHRGRWAWRRWPHRPLRGRRDQVQRRAGRVPASSRWARPGWRSRTAAARRVVRTRRPSPIWCVRPAADSPPAAHCSGDRGPVRQRCGAAGGEHCRGGHGQRIDDVGNGRAAYRGDARQRSCRRCCRVSAAPAISIPRCAMAPIIRKGRLPGRTSSASGLVASVSRTQRDHYGEERCRVSPLIQRKHSPEPNFHGQAVQTSARSPGHCRKVRDGMFANDPGVQGLGMEIEAVGRVTRRSA